jgi:molecular chaperone DnaK
MADLREALKGEDADKIKDKLAVLQQRSGKLAEAAQQQAGSADAPGSGAAAGDDGVVDAEFTEVDDDK